MAVRYRNSVDPVRTDGRDLDVAVAELIGEAASQQASGSAGKHIGKMAEPWPSVPAPQPADPSYYDRPMLQESVWGWAIPAYYYVGGLTGASLAVGAAARAFSPKNTRSLVRRCRWIGFIGACISGALLIYDLGRPTRFLNMLRVFRPTSPMNVGAWILSGVGGTATLALVLSELGASEPAADAFGYLAGVLGCGLATYTGVLVSNTAVPLWQQSRRVLPVLFGSSAITSVGATFDMFVENEEERRITKAFGTVGQVAEIVASILVEKEASVVPRVARPLKRGVTGFLWKTATLLTATGLVLGFLPRPTRNRRIAAGVLGTVGSLVMRYTIEHAGVLSSRDPRASFHQQRAGHGAAEETGATQAIR